MLDFYKYINLKEGKVEDILKKYNGDKVLIKDEHSGDILIGGILNFNPDKDPKIYYLSKEKVQKMYHVNDLEQLLILLP